MHYPQGGALGVSLCIGDPDMTMQKQEKQLATNDSHRPCNSICYYMQSGYITLAVILSKADPLARATWRFSLLLHIQYQLQLTVNRGTSVEKPAVTQTASTLLRTGHQATNHENTIPTDYCMPACRKV
jgi:hypothetical protein